MILKSVTFGQSLFAAAVVAGWFAVGGCTGNSPTLVEVTGRITDGGKAVPGASVSYQPIAVSKDEIFPGPASFGITDTDGRYRLRTFNHDQPGAIPGQHRVCISYGKVGEQREFAPVPMAKQVPARFCDGSTIVEVPANGAAEVSFDLAKQ